MATVRLTNPGVIHALRSSSYKPGITKEGATVVDPASAAALQSLVSKLVDLGIDQWRRKEESRRCLSGILSALRVELCQNWVALDKGDPDAKPIALSTQAWVVSGASVSAALADGGRIRRLLEVAYTRCGQPVASKSDQMAGLIDVGMAIIGLDEFRQHERLEHDNPHQWECERPRSFGQLLLGMPMEAMIEIHEVWKRWLEAVKAGQYRPYDFDEVDAKRARRDPLVEAEFRAKANREYQDKHCFELERGIYEYWLDEETRIVFTIENRRPEPLDLIRLSGPEAESWTPSRLLAIARCRRETPRAT